jgi:excisionase family DNA binding protein
MRDVKVGFMNPVPTPDERPTLTVEEAGAALGIGRASAYSAARNGDLPTIRVGRRLLVPTAPFRAMLGLDAVGGAA